LDIAILVKVVPASDTLRHDPLLRTAVRDGVPLFLNPFDQRALRVGLDLRKPGEAVTVLSMGPPAIEPALREAIGLGADRVVLLTDPQFAGSDTLATSRTLVRALGRVGHGLVLAGRASTDSETAQVGPEVAGLLGVPVVSSARKISRDEEGDGLEVVGETETGIARYRVEPPAVITVGEKIVKIRRPTPEEIAATAGRVVEYWSAEELGMTPEHIGASGSPTVVLSLGEEAPRRRALVFDRGTILERVVAAVEALPKAPGGPALSGSALEPVRTPLRDDDEVMVLVTGPEGRLEPPTLSVIAEVRRTLAPCWPSAVWVGGSPSPTDDEALDRAGAVRGYRVGAGLSDIDSRLVAVAFHQLVEERPRAAAGLFLSDTFGREVAGQVAARAGLGLTGDAISFEEESDGGLLWSKPAFGGSVVAKIRCRTRPNLATIRAGVFEPPPEVQSRTRLSWEERSYDLPPPSVRCLERTVEDDPRFGDLDRASTILCVGRGIGGPETIEGLRPLLARLSAALAATRKVVDAGWVPRHRQAGLTGRSLAPRLVILVGVSGAVNHLVAWRRAGTILAINADPLAAVFHSSDIGIVGAWQEALPALVDALTSPPASR
jgi:electron transfer flavoprotein alpha subunit